jgi:hypothetical protein
MAFSGVMDEAMSIAKASVRKDVECTFSLLKKRFNILVIPIRSYSQHTPWLIMHDCIILHNMIIDNERDDSYDDNYVFSNSLSTK